MRDYREENGDGWILTHGGRRLELRNPCPAAIDIYDIAVGLSRECRFSGQCQRFYSVAQHSVLASMAVPLEYAMEALLHDAAEAFIKDLPTPLKRLLPEYVQIEQRLDRTIRKRFGLPEEMSTPVKRVDRILLATEKRDLLGPDSGSWAILEGVDPLPNAVVPWSSGVALERFVFRFHELLDASGRLEWTGTNGIGECKR